MQNLGKDSDFEGNFFEHSFQDMSPGEVSHTVFFASKMDVENEAFWKRASLAVGDLAGAMTCRQLTEACWAFGASKWHDAALVKALASPIMTKAPEMNWSFIVLDFLPPWMPGHLQARHHDICILLVQVHW